MGDKQVKLAVCILNFNNYEKACLCLESCIRQEGKYDIYLFDNNSSDGSYDKLYVKFHDNIEFIRNSNNLGFARANNDIVRIMNEKGYSHTLLLNNDVEFPHDNAFNCLVEAIMCNSRAGIIAPAVINRRKTGDELVTNSSMLIRAMVATRVIPRQVNIVEESRYKNVYTAHGCAMVVNNDIFIEVDGFPEENYMYGEETMLCRKLNLSQIPIVQCLPSECTVYHNHELSYGQEPWRNYLCGRNMYFEIKLYKGWRKFAYSVFMKLLKMYYVIKKEEGYRDYIQGLDEGRRICKSRLSSTEIRALTVEYVARNAKK